MGNGTLDPGFAACVGCAVLSRSLARTNTTVNGCQKCFADYCWNGTTATQTPPAYFPELKMAAAQPACSLLDGSAFAAPPSPDAAS